MGGRERGWEGERGRDGGSEREGCRKKKKMYIIIQNTHNVTEKLIKMPTVCLSSVYTDYLYL